MLRGLTSIFYGLTWSILGAFWYHGAGGVGKMSAFEGWWRIVPLLSVPFILAGFSFWFYPLRLGFRARRTWYLVTNQRVFIAELGPKMRRATSSFLCPKKWPPAGRETISTGSTKSSSPARPGKPASQTPPRFGVSFGLENGEAAAGRDQRDDESVAVLAMTKPIRRS